MHGPRDGAKKKGEQTMMNRVKTWGCALRHGVWAVLAALALSPQATALPLAAVREAGEAAGKIAVTVGGREAAEASVRAGARHGGEAVAVTAVRGGAEAAEAAARGARIAGGAGARSGIPKGLSQTLGPHALALEQRAPGLGARSVELFGEEGARALAAAPKLDDLPTLIAYAEKADTPATRQLLLRRWRETGGEVLKRLDWKVVAATGVSVALITAAYQVGDGAQHGFKTVAEESDVVVKYVVAPCLIMLALASAYRIARRRGPVPAVAQAATLPSRSEIVSRN